MKTLLFSPPKYNGKFITVNDCCWGTGGVQVLQDRLLRTGSYLMTQGDQVRFLDAGMKRMTWADVWKELKAIKPDHLIFGVTPQFESWQMIVAEICLKLGITLHAIGITEGYERYLLDKYHVFTSFTLNLPPWDKMPPINWNLLGNNYPCYFTYQISDGCPYSCKFCVWAKKDYKLLPPELILENLKPVKSSAAFYLLCAQITTNKKWLERFVELKKEFNLDFGYVTDLHCKEVTEDKIEMLVESSCVGATMGVESTNQDVLDSINKGISLDDIESAISICKAYNLELTVPFMYNVLPTENVDNDIDFYLKHKSFKPSPGIMKIYPGTALADETYEFDYIFELGTNPIATNKGLDEALRKLEKWESVLNG